MKERCSEAMYEEKEGRKEHQKPRIGNSAGTEGWRGPDSGNVASAGKRESGIVSFGSSEEFAAWGW